jgi:hypothetical protein
MERNFFPSLGAAAGIALGAFAAFPAFAQAVDFPGRDAPPSAARSEGTLDGSTEFSYFGDAATADTTDRAVAERVMDALATDPALEGSAITVLVDQGRVRLSGRARDEDQAAYALEIARDAAGPAVDVTGEGLRAGEPAGTAG